MSGETFMPYLVSVSLLIETLDDGRAEHGLHLVLDLREKAKE